MRVPAVSRNALAALLQAAFVSVCLFLIFRTVVQSTGIEYLGLWSLLMIGASVARAGDVSGAASLSRFVAMKQAGVSFGGTTREIIHTVLLTSIVFNVIFCLLILSFAPLLLSYVLPPQMVGDGVALIPYVVAIITLGGLVSGIASTIDGLQRADIRALVLSLSALIVLAASQMLVPIMGIEGFAIAQIVGQCATIAAGWAVLRWQLSDIGWLPMRWNSLVCRTTVAYGVKLNSIGVLGLLCEPLVKFCFGVIWGPAEVGLYELASRTISQIRGLVVAAAMPLIPAISGAKDTAERHSLLKDAMHVVSLAAPAVSVVALTAMPVVSLIVLDEMSKVLLTMSIPLIFAWSINTVAIPFYLAAQADGRMRWNAISYLIIAFFVVIGAILSGGTGSQFLIWALAAGLILSNAIMMVGNAWMMGLVSILRNSASPLIFGAAFIAIVCIIAHNIFTKFLDL